MVMVMWIHKNESIAQLSSDESALHVQKEFHLRPLFVLRRKYGKKITKKKKKIKLCSQIGFETYAVILSLIVFKPWKDACNVFLFM